MKRSRAIEDHKDELNGPAQRATFVADATSGHDFGDSSEKFDAIGCPEDDSLSSDFEHEDTDSKSLAYPSLIPSQRLLHILWDVKRFDTDGDSWNKYKGKVGFQLECHDVGHTGCCKACSLATLIVNDPPWAHRHRLRPGTPTELEPHVRAMRSKIAYALDEETFNLLKSAENTNHADWRKFTTIIEAKNCVALTYKEGRKIGFNMSPVVSAETFQSFR